MFAGHILLCSSSLGGEYLLLHGEGLLGSSSIAVPFLMASLFMTSSRS